MISSGCTVLHFPINIRCSGIARICFLLLQSQIVSSLAVPEFFKFQERIFFTFYGQNIPLLIFRANFS